jgi:dihydroneopterin aldolase
MKKLIGRLLFVSVAALLIGCGGGSGSGSGNKYVFIMHDTPSGICEDERFIDALEEEGIRGVSTKEYENETMFCVDFPNAKGCEEEHYTDDTDDAELVDCVVHYTEYTAKQIAHPSKKVVSSTEDVSSAIANSVSDALKQ